MAEQRKRLTVTGLIFELLLLAVLGIIFFTGSEFAQEQTIREGRMIVNELGEDTADYIRARADGWYDGIVVENRMEEEVLHFFIPTKEEKRNSRGMETMGSGLFVWVEERINVFFDLIFWVFKRLALLLVWLPLLLPLLVVAVGDGLCQRNIKKQNFALASSFWQRFGTVGTAVFSAGLLLLFCIPYAIPPVVAPVLLAIISVLIGMTVGNVQKRL